MMTSLHGGTMTDDIPLVPHVEMPPAMPAICMALSAVSIPSATISGASSLIVPSGT